MVNIRHGERESKIFKILLKDRLKLDSQDNKFGPFEENQNWVNNEIAVEILILPTKVPKLIGR